MSNFHLDKKKLQFERTSRNMSQEELAQEIKVSTRSVSRWETGESNPRGDDLERLASFLGYRPIWSRTEEDYPLTHGTEIASHLIFAKTEEKESIVSEKLLLNMLSEQQQLIRIQSNNMTEALATVERQRADTARVTEVLASQLDKHNDQIADLREELSELKEQLAQFAKPTRPTRAAESRKASPIHASAARPGRAAER